LNNMNDSDTNVGTRQSVVAIVREDDVLKGIELRRRDGATEILWTRSAERKGADWQSFAAECGLSAKSTADHGADSDRTVVVGFGSAGTVFHRTSVPPVEEQEIESIVRLQAETRLPLPAEQTELAWRADPAHNGQVGVTMVVARKELLQGFARDVRCLDPTKILLDCEGIIKAWRTVFSEHEKDAIVVSMGAKNTQVCLVEDGRLSNAVILDLGITDFSEDAHEQKAETMERFARDMRSVVDLFGYADGAKLPVFVLSDNNAIYVSIVSSLRSADLNARIALPDTQRLTGPGESGAEWIYEYRAPIGLALMALEDGADELNIFEHVYTPADQQEKKHWLYSPKVACSIAVMMLLLLAIVTYAIDTRSPKAIKARLDASAAETKMDLDALVQRQNLIRTVAQERPDVLALIKLVNGSGEKGVLLNSLHFRKDQKVSITGQVQSSDQLYKFQETLRKNKDLAKVEIQTTGKVSGASSSRSSGPSGRPGGAPPGRSGSGGKGGVTFTITFHYKNFTKKIARTRS